MAIRLACACGSELQARDEWVGRRVKCTRCGEILTVPRPNAAEEFRAGETYDVVNEELTPPVSSPAPFVSQGPRPAPKRGVFRRLLRRLPGYREVVFKWKEPAFYRTRLKGDLHVRLAIAAGFWGLPTAVFLLLFGINVNPPGIGVAAMMGALFGLAPLLMILLAGRKTASGLVKVYGDEIHRSRYYQSLDFAHWTERATWPLEAIHQCVIVEGQSLGKSFSVMLLSTECGVDMIGIPKNIDLGHLAEHLDARGVPVVRGETIPPKFTKRVPVEIAVICGVMGAACFFGGLLFYLDHVWDMARQTAQREEIEKRSREKVPDDDKSEDRKRHDRLSSSRDPHNQLAGSPPPDPIPADSFVVNQTELAGGAGGVPFQKVSVEREAVLGFRYSIGSWDGEDALQDLEPLFQRDTPREWENIILAREGYAVGGLVVNAGEFVNGLQIVFMAMQPDGSLDAGDSYTSDWIGVASTATTTVGGTGVKVIGIHGRHAAILDAVGLLTDVR